MYRKINEIFERVTNLMLKFSFHSGEGDYSQKVEFRFK